MKKTLERLFVETLAELDLAHVLPACIPSDLERARVFAFGKAAGKMAELAPFGGASNGGIVVGPAAPERELAGFEHFVGGHPYPNAGSFAAGDAILAEAARLGADDTALFLISGGGSALVEKPIADVDLVAVNRTLVTSGADIVSMNIVRKHLSALKGGRLAVAAAPARQVTLYVSDAPAAHPDAVASGPTMPDPSTVEECYAIARRVGLALPPSLPETPKAEHPAFQRSEWRRVLDNDDAVRALARRAREEGWVVAIDTDTDDLPVDDAVDRLLDRLRALRGEHPGRTVALVAGGELSCPVKGDGVGGRNATFALRCAARIVHEPITVLSAGTDGIDGNSPAAGAVADGETVTRGGDPQPYDDRSDAHAYFARLDDAVVTGPTHNNVRDLRILVAS